MLQVAERDFHQYDVAHQIEDRDWRTEPCRATAVRRTYFPMASHGPRRVGFFPMDMGDELAPAMRRLPEVKSAVAKIIEVLKILRPVDEDSIALGIPQPASCSLIAEVTEQIVEAAYLDAMGKCPCHDEFALFYESGLELDELPVEARNWLHIMVTMKMLWRKDHALARRVYRVVYDKFLAAGIGLPKL